MSQTNVKLDLKSYSIVDFYYSGIFTELPAMMPAYDQKLAIAVNHLLDSFQCIEEGLATLGVTRSWFQELWSGQASPPGRIFQHFITEWGVNPLFIYHNNVQVLLHQE